MAGIYNGFDTEGEMEMNIADLPSCIGVFNELNEIPQYPPSIDVYFQDVMREYEKDQEKMSRKRAEATGRSSRQVVTNGKVHFIVTSTVDLNKFLLNAYVRRTYDAAAAMATRAAYIKGEYRDAAKMNINILEKNYTLGQINCEINLGEAYYTQQGDPVFTLSTTKTDERNMFEIVVSILVDGEFLNRCFTSDPFLVKSKEKGKKETNVSGAKKQCKRNDGYESLNDGNIAGASAGAWSPENLSGVEFSPGSESSAMSSGSFSTNNDTVFSVEALAAEKAFIKELEFVKLITRDKGDAGYRIKLKSPNINESWGEGTVVAFVPGPLGDTCIEELSQENVKIAKLAGVVSRSAYIESKIMVDDEPNDIVCIMGVVHVNMMGNVHNGEAVYGSPLLPGTGISKSTLQLMGPYDESELIMLGQALETKEAAFNSQIIHVKCLVSLLLGIQSKRIMDVVRDQKENTRIQMNQRIVKEKKKITKYTAIAVASAVIFLILLGVMVREFVSRSTAFQYFLCKRGVLSTKPACLKFRSALGSETRRVKGFEFEWSVLKKKLGLTVDSLENTQLLSSNETYSYFLNIDRCAYTRLWFRDKGDKNVLVMHGVEVFAIPKRRKGKGKKWPDKLYHITDDEWEELRKNVKVMWPC